ncbi:unnamed protein product [Sympodiomycopsis kandeliae]
MADQQPPQQGGAGGNMDYLDKAVDQGLDRSGHHQDRDKVEKISDGIRSGFKKLTGKDVPGGDKNPN